MGTLLLIFRIIEAILIYAFFIGVLFLLYKLIKNELTIAQEKKVGASFTRLDNEDEATRKQIFEKQIITIGRSNDCDVFVDNPTVSNLHARITFTQGKWWLEDTNSTNGTMLNDLLIDQPTVLIDLDEITVGDQRIIFNTENL
ncbi:MAG TPA: FHA domain-containing protein [Anaerolineales bacterium]|nr:FHA domain-containing protein [Anaerolineales bacterium]